MTKYGATDPAVYQLRDIKRRLTRAEDRLDRTIGKLKGATHDISVLRQAFDIFVSNLRLILPPSGENTK